MVSLHIRDIFAYLTVVSYYIGSFNLISTFDVSCYLLEIRFYGMLQDWITRSIFLQICLIMKLATKATWYFRRIMCYYLFGKLIL